MEQIPSPVPSPTTTATSNYPEMSTGNAKILQNLLYGHTYLPNPYVAASPYLDDPFRPRSGSLLSLGSTGSSHRTERSPSRESNSSHESLLRASPISLAPESPSPSPPTGSDSKLLNILKGNLSSSYASLFNNRPQKQQAHNLEVPSAHHHSHHQHHAQAPKRQYSLQETPKTEPVTYNFTKRHVPCDEAPMDLSFKKSKVDANPPRRFTMPSATITKANALRAKMAAAKTQQVKLPPPLPQHQFLEPISPPPRVSSRDSVQSNEEQSGSSILRSILSGSGTIGASPRPTLALVMSRERQAMSAPTSPAAQTFSAPPSPRLGSQYRLLGSSPCDQNQRVTIAKKTVYPVRARVTDWLQKIIQFCQALPDFSSLSPSEQLILVTKTWSRLLLLSMAEHHFEFAVTPVMLDHQPEAEQDTGRSDLPTMKSVEGIEGFIRKCQNLGLDAIEYQCIKTAVLYQTGLSGFTDRKHIESLGAEARRQLQKHVTITRPHEKMRYSSILLLCHTLSGINATMVQNLFCQHILSQTSMETHFETLLVEGQTTT